MKKLVHLALCAFSLLTGGAASAQYMIHIAGNNNFDHAGDSSKAVTASLRCPMSVCRDDIGNLYIADGGPIGYNNDACIRRIDTAGIITTIAGRRGAADAPDNTMDSMAATAAKLQGCAGICMDKAGNLLIADGISMIRKINLTTGAITTIAGARGAASYSGDGGPATAARLKSPYDIAVDNSNNIYVAELGSNVVRKIYAGGGLITTVAGRYGTFGFSGDGGPAVNAKLDQPRGIYVDNSGNIYIADYNNHRVRVVNATTNVITTMVGSSAGFGGDGGPANNGLLNLPVRITMDNTNNLYIADAANQRIRKVAAGTGTITTYAGNGDFVTGPDVLGDGGPATAASITPYGMCFDPCGNMFVGSSMFNLRAVVPVKPQKGRLCGVKVASAGSVQPVSEAQLQVFPDPTYGQFTIRLTAAGNEPAAVVITDIAGRVVKELTTITNRDAELQLNEPAGMYFIQASTATGRWSTKLVIR